MATATKPDKKPFHVALAEKLIGHLESGTAPWQRPWEPGASWLPFNPTSGKHYKGINVLQLLSEERADPRWMTYKQALAAGAQVRRGERGTPVQYWKFEDERNVKDAAGKPVVNERGEARKETVRLDQARVFFATVFNAEQIDGLAPLEKREVTWNVEETIEARLRLATFKHDQPNRAFYRPSTDTIHMPAREQFPDAKGYYHVALHELAHWSGHPNRMARDLGNPPGSPEYAREELRAEIASLLMGAETGLGHEPNQNASAYVSHWVKDLRERPLEIFRAASDAEKIRGLIADLTQQQQQQQSNQALTPDLEPMKPEAAPSSPVAARVVLPDQPPVPVAVVETQRIYLAVPFGEKNAAKALGARWDAERKSWYAPNEEIAAKLDRWRPERLAARQEPALPPREEFAQALQGLSFRLKEDHPVLDGKPRRVPVEGDRRGEAAGFYVGYSDGHPAGYAMNNRTGDELRWKAKGYTLSDEERSVLAAEAAARLQAREQQTHEQQIEAARRIEGQLRGAKPPAADTPYLEAKQIEATKGIFADKECRTLLVPGYDAEGKIWTAQYIQDDGTKRFAKGSRKEGCFHVIGGMAELNRRPVIVIAEGYATANTLAAASEGRAAVVSAFDAGNLEPVARALRERFPDKPLLIAADDDRATPEQNRGREFASRAARSVGAECITPTFATGEQAGDPRRFSDFNDVKVHSALGFIGLKEQLLPALERAVGVRAPEREQGQEHGRDGGAGGAAPEDVAGPDRSPLPSQRGRSFRSGVTR